MSWAILILVMTIVSLGTAFIDWLLPELSQRLAIDYVKWWVKLEDSDYQTVVASVDTLFQRYAGRLFGKEIISLRAYAAAALLSLTGFLSFLFLKTFFLYHRGATRTFWGAAEEGVLFTFWDLRHFAAFRGIIVGWGFTLFSLAITRYGAKTTSRDPVWRQLLMLYANVLLVIYFGFIATGAYYSSNWFPELFLDPLRPLDFLKIDYFNHEIVFLYFPLGLACALPVIFRAGSITFMITAKLFRRPVYGFSERLLRRLADTGLGILSVIVILFDSVAILLNAILDVLERH